MRSRNIKPGFFENEKLAELSPLARILYVGLWCYADREGRFEWRPKRIKAVILPYDECNVEEMLMSLHAMTFIDMYETSSGTVGCIPKFKEHQNPHPHEAKSKLPPKSESNQRHDMSLHVSDMSAKCNADIRIPDIRIPDSRIPIKEKNIPHADGVTVGEQEPFYLTKKKRKLKGKRLDAFNRFWTAFEFPKGKAEAADAWLDIPTLTEPLVEEIVKAAEAEAANRAAAIADGRTPKWAQGWITGRRWEDKVIQFRGDLTPEQRAQKDAEEMRKIRAARSLQ